MLTTLAPATLAPIANRTLAYADYIAGCDADSEPFTELAYELGQLFEGIYTPPVLAQALRELQPQVLLISQEEDGVVRPDYPLLADTDVDALAQCAADFTTLSA